MATKANNQPEPDFVWEPSTPPPPPKAPNQRRKVLIYSGVTALVVGMLSVVAFTLNDGTGHATDLRTAEKASGRTTPATTGVTTTPTPTSTAVSGPVSSTAAPAHALPSSSAAAPAVVTSTSIVQAFDPAPTGSQPSRNAPPQSPASSTRPAPVRNAPKPSTTTPPPTQAPPSSQASPPPAQDFPGRPLTNPATGQCLSGSAGSDGTPLILWGCNGNVNQKWDIRSDGTIHIKGVLCMDAAWGGTAPGTIVQIAYCSGNPAQLFTFTGSALLNRQANLCVEIVNGGSGMRLQPCNGNPNQVWRQG